MGDLLHPTESSSDDDDTADETPSDPGEFVLAMTADDRMEAQLLISACEEAGIPAILEDPRSGTVGKLSSPVHEYNILVPRRDAARALPLMEDRRAALEADPEGAAKAAEAEEATGEKG
jgi:hypothetical protein